MREKETKDIKVKVTRTVQQSTILHVRAKTKYEAMRTAEAGIKLVGFDSLKHPHGVSTEELDLKMEAWE